MVRVGQPIEGKSGMKFGDFDSDFARAQAAARLPCWESEWYPKCLLGQFVRRELREANGPDQHDCIDAIIHATTSYSGVAREIKVEEKVRFEAWDDFLFEIWSDSKRKKAGWGTKPARAEYLSYRILPTGRGWFIPFQIMQSAWSQYGDLWIQEAHGTKTKKNWKAGRVWITEFVIVKPDLLEWSLGKATNVSVSPLPDWEDPDAKDRRETREEAARALAEWRQGCSR